MDRLTFDRWWEALPSGLKNPAVKAPCKRGWDAALLQSLSQEAVRDEVLARKEYGNVYTTMSAKLEQYESLLKRWLIRFGSAGGHSALYDETKAALKREPNAAGQVPHGVCRADDPNREATSLPDGSVGLPQAAASACNIEASERGEAVSVSDDRLGTRIPAPAAPNYDDGDPAKWPPSGPAAPDVASMVKRLEDYYDFQCEGGPLKNCVEWIKVKEALLARLGQEWIPVSGYAEARARFGGEGVKADKHSNAFIYFVDSKTQWFAMPLPPAPGASDD